MHRKSEMPKPPQKPPNATLLLWITLSDTSPKSEACKISWEVGRFLLSSSLEAFRSLLNSLASTVCGFTAMWQKSCHTVPHKDKPPHDMLQCVSCALCSCAAAQGHHTQIIWGNVCMHARALFQGDSGTPNNYKSHPKVRLSHIDFWYGDLWSPWFWKMDSTKIIYLKCL